MIGAAGSGAPRRLTSLSVVAASSPEPLLAVGSAATSGAAIGAVCCARLTGAGVVCGVVVNAERRLELM